jgi:hypothetical protein
MGWVLPRPGEYSASSVSNVAKKKKKKKKNTVSYDARSNSSLEVMTRENLVAKRKKHEQERLKSKGKGHVRDAEG